MSIVVHHLEASRSHRILWLLEELAVPYEVKRYRRDPKTWRAPPELRAVHPLGKSPAVEVDGDVLVESGAIVEALLDRFGAGRLRPTDRAGLERFRFWLHYAEGSVMTPLLVALLTARIRKAKLPFFIKPIARRIADGVDGQYTTAELAGHFGYIEGELGAHPYFVGDAFTAADIQMSYAVDAGRLRAGVTAATHPNTWAWLERVRARPAYQAAVQRGGGEPLAR